MNKYHVNFYYKGYQAGNGFDLDADSYDLAMKMAEKLIQSFSVDVPENWSRFEAELAHESVANEYSVRPAPGLHCN